MQIIKKLSEVICGINLHQQPVKLYMKFSINNVSKLTPNPPNKLLSAKFLVCFNFQSASMLLKVNENVV